MKQLLFTVLLAAHAAIGLAQTHAAPTGATPAGAIGRFSTGKQDTMRALGNMYVRHNTRRRAGKIWLGVALAGGLATLRVATAKDPNASNNSYSPAPARNNDALAVVGGIFAGVPLLIGVLKLAGSSSNDQDSVVARYARRQPLPVGVVRQLRRKDFD